MSESALPEIPNTITNAGAIRRLVSNLYQGWGYNAYRKENQLRADDLLIRGRISQMLSALRRRWAEREAKWREERIPAPTREHPYPDPEAILAAKAMQYVQKKIEALEVLIRTAPVPENDRVWQRHRNEADTLQKLMTADQDILEQVITLMESAGSVSASEFSLEPVQNAWEQRQALLFG